MNCPFCNKPMKWKEEDIYVCETHGKFKREKVIIAGFRWLEDEGQ